MNIQVRVLSRQAQTELRQLRARVAELEAAEKAANATASRFGAGGVRALEKWGSQVQWAGRQLTYNFTMPIALAMGAATKFALANEASMTRLKKVYGDGSRDAKFYSKEIDALGRSFEAMSNHFGVARADVQNIAADWAAAGSSGVALAKATKLTLETMILGELDAATATKTLISIQAQYNFSTQQLVQTIDTLNQIENQTGASMGDLIDGFSRAAGVAREAGIDVNHLGAMIAALTPAAGSASQAGNALKTIISRLLAPTKDAADIMDKMGLKVHDASWQSMTATQRLEAMSRAFTKASGSTRANISATVASRWQINKFAVLMTDMAGKLGYYHRALEATSDATANQTQREKELTAVLNSSPQKFKQIGTVMQNVLADAIVPLIPELIRIGHAFQAMFTWFGNLDPNVKKLIIGLLAVIAVIGPLMRLLGSFATLFGYVGSATKLAWKGVSFFTDALWAMVKAPFKWIWAGLSGIVTGLLAIPGAVVKGAAAMVRLPGILGTVSTGLVVGGHMLINYMKTLPTLMGTMFMSGLARMSALMNVAMIPVFNGVAAFFQTILVGSFSATMGRAWQILSGRFSAFLAFGLMQPLQTAVASVGAWFTVMWTNIAAIFSAGSAGSALASFKGFLAMMLARLGAFTTAAATFFRTLPMLFSVAWSGIGIAFTTGIKAVSARFDLWLAGMYLRTVAWGTGITTFFATVYGKLGILVARAGAAMTMGVSGIMQIWPAITGVFYAAYQSLYAGLLKIQAAFAPASAKLQAAWAAMSTAITRAYGAVILPLWAAIHTGLMTVQRVFLETSIKVWGAFSFAMTRVMTVLGTMMTTAWGATMAAMRTAWMATVAFLTSPVRMLAAMRFLMTGLWTVMMTGGKALITGAMQIGKLLMAAFSGPWGWAILAVVLMMTTFREDVSRIWNNITSAFSKNAGAWAAIFAPVVKFFQDAVGWIERAFWRLPQGVRDALMTVVRLVQQAAQGVRDMFANMFSMFGGGGQKPPIQKHATGGTVRGPGTGTSDSVIIAASNGEEIINAHSAAKHRGLLKAINADRFATGGTVGKAADKARKNANTGGVQGDLAAYKQISDQLNGIQWNKEMATVAKGFASALPLFKSLLADYNALNTQMKKAEQAVNAQQKVVDVWKGRLDAANTALDAQQKKLDGLQGKLDGLNQKYDEHKTAMENFANAPIQGMGAMSDAIFDNQMAQKKLQLQMLQWEKQHGSIDKIKNSMALLQGEIEKVQGTVKDLRAGGAGSDITGPLEEQVKTMKDQYAAMGQQVQNSPISQMQDQLDALAQRGQELDLENSLKFDPLTRQVDKLANGMKELPFDQIIAGISGEQAAMAALQPQIDAANAAVEKQKAVVDAATAARDQIQASYDAETAKLDKLKGTYDALRDSVQAVEDAMRGLSTAANDNIQAAKEAADKKKSVSPAMQSYLDSLKAADFADPGGKSKIGREGGIGDQSAEIDKLTADLTKQLDFGALDMFAPIKEMWNSAWAWVEKNVAPKVKQVWDALYATVEDMFSGAGDSGLWGGITTGFKNVWNTLVGWWNGFVEVLKQAWLLFGTDITRIFGSVKDFFLRIWNEIFPKLGGLFSALGGLVQAVWPFIKALAGIIGGLLLGAIKIVASVISNTLGPVLNWLADAFGSIIDILTGVIHFWTDVFTGNWSNLWQDIKDIFGAVWDGIFAIFNGVVQTVWGIIKGFVEGIIGFFAWLYDVLLGHSIIPDIVNGMVQWFKDAWTWVVDLVSGLVNGVIDWFSKLPGRVWDALSTLGQNLYNIASAAFKWFKDTMTTGWSNIWNWIKNLPADTYNGLIILKDKLASVGTTAMNWFKDKLKAGWDLLWGWMKNLPSDTWNGLIILKDKLANVGSTAMQWFKDKLGSGWSTIWTWLTGLPKSAWDAVIGIKDKLMTIGSDAMGGFFTKIKSLWDGPNGILNWFAGIPGKIGSKLSGIGTAIGDIVKKAWNAAAGWINTNAIKGIREIASKFGLEIPYLPGFKDGGIIPGPRSAHDNMIVRARSGEGVLIPEAVDRIGGKKGLEQLNKTARKGGDINDWLEKSGVGEKNSDFGVGGSLLDDVANWMKQGAGYAVSRVMDPVAGFIEDHFPKPEVLSKFVSGSMRNLSAKAKTWGREEDQKAADAAAKTGLGGLTPAQLAVINAAGTYFPVNGPITAGYGFYPNSHKPHNGIDFGVPVGTNVRAWRGGKVIYSGWDTTGYGNYVEMQHADNTISRYGHNSMLLRKVGDIVQGGGVISKSGSTGNSTGPHVHFGIKKNGMATDPWPYLTGQKFDTGGFLKPGMTRVRNETGRPEPVFTADQWSVLKSLVATSSSVLKSVGAGGVGSTTGLRGAASVSFEARLRRLESTSTVSSKGEGDRTVNFYGDLSFPGIKNGDDAESFLKNLESLAG